MNTLGIPNLPVNVSRLNNLLTYPLKIISKEQGVSENTPFKDFSP